jgi:tetratricopeptide (TPR) repeat protein
MTAAKHRLWTAVWFYFVLTLLPVLGIVQVGGQSMADRYAYLPSIGPILIMGIGVARGLTRLSAGRENTVLRHAALALLIPVFFCLSYLTVEQTRRWKDDLTLWTYVIDKESTRVLIAYYNRGLAYARTGRIPEAIEDFNMVIALNYQEDSQSYINRGLAFYQVGQIERAIADLRKLRTG